MSLYLEVKSYVDPVSLQRKNTTNEMLRMPKEEFRDILALYIKLVWILKSQWVKDLFTTWEIKDFVARDFDYLILSKWNNIMNELILWATIKKCAIMCQSYIESKLIAKKPQLEYFTQFQLWNFEWLEYVFNKHVFNKDIIFSYKDEDGKDINVIEKWHYNSLKKADLDLIFKSIKSSDKILSLLMRIKEAHFNIYKKFLIIAAEETYKWNDLEENGEFMLNITTAIKELDENLNK